MKGKELSLKIFASCIPLIAMVLLLVSVTKSEVQAQESTISRTFSATPVCEGEIIEVSLHVIIRGGETFYALEEFVPEGWVVIDAAGGQCNPVNRLCWVVISGAEDTTYTYTIQAPSATGNYIFDGFYMFEGFTDPVTTFGETTIEVVDESACEDCIPVWPSRLEKANYWKKQCCALDVIDCSYGYKLKEEWMENIPELELQDICEILYKPENVCEKAEKQLQALLLNMESGRVAECNCLREGLEVSTVGEAIEKIQSLINEGQCKKARKLASKINKGDPFVADCLENEPPAPPDGLIIVP